MSSLLVRVTIMIIVYFLGMLMGGVFVGALEAMMIDAGDMVIYVRKGENWVKLLDPDPDEVID